MLASEHHVDWTRVFWRNSNMLCNRSAPLTSRMRFWKQLAWGVADYRLAMVRPVKTNIEALDSACSKLVRYIAGAHPRSSETKEAFVQRRNREIGHAKSEVGLLIRKRACWKLCCWVEHIHRHPQLPCLELLTCQGTDWLRQRRSDLVPSSNGTSAGKTCTRTGAGRPFRWDSGWVGEVGSLSGSGWENPSKDKGLTASRADILYNSIFA